MGAGVRKGPGVSTCSGGEGASGLHTRTSMSSGARSEGERWGRPGIWCLTLLLFLSPSIPSLNHFLNEHLLRARECEKYWCGRCVSRGSCTFGACSRSSQGCLRGGYAEHMSYLLILVSVGWFMGAHVHERPAFAHTSLFSWNSVCSTNICCFIFSPNSAGTSLHCENFLTLDIDHSTHNFLFMSLPRCV